jgi:hypothetical protein
MKGTGFRRCGKTPVYEEYGLQRAAKKLRSLARTPVYEEYGLQPVRKCFERNSALAAEA